MSQSQDSVSSNQQEAHSTSLAGRIGLFLGPLFMLGVLVLPAPAGMDVVELAAWTATANVIMNLDEYLMRR